MALTLTDALKTLAALAPVREEATLNELLSTFEAARPVLDSLHTLTVQAAPEAHSVIDAVKTEIEHIGSEIKDL